MALILPGEEAFDADCGIWCWAAPPPAGPKRPALFLDRDGVVNEDIDYLRRVEDVQIIPGAADVIARANRKGLPVVLVTNQGGLGLGHFDWATLSQVQAKIHDDLAALGAQVDAVMACPFHPRGDEPYRHDSHPARKPNPGMLIRAAELLSLDLAKSWIVGDRASDIEAGRNAGLAGGVLVFTGYGRSEEAKALALHRPGFEVSVADSIKEAAQFVRLL
jgi:D-glycero-D-manno-heptose 1,7-bisphosphate phosphatase